MCNAVACLSDLQMRQFSTPVFAQSFLICPGIRQYEHNLCFHTSPNLSASGTLGLKQFLEKCPVSEQNMHLLPFEFIVLLPTRTLKGLPSSCFFNCRLFSSAASRAETYSSRIRKKSEIFSFGLPDSSISIWSNWGS